MTTRQKCPTPKNFCSTPLTANPLKSRLSQKSTAKRFTPYGKTPQSRRIAKAFPSTQGRRKVVRTKSKGLSNSNTESEELKGFTNKTWKVFKLSPLYKFSSSPRDLKRYGQLLSSSVAMANQKGIIEENNASGKAFFCVQQGVKKSQNDPDAIQILIKGRKHAGTTDTVLLTATLCGVEMEENLLSHDMENFTYYPVLLVKATVVLADVLITWLQRHFDCKVSPLVFPPVDLVWMIAMWSGALADTGHKNKPVELIYLVPSECEGIKKVTYTIQAEDCLKVWNSIHDSKAEMFTEEEMTTFISCLEEHFYCLFRIKLDAMQLSCVGTSLCYIGRDSLLKIYSAEHVPCILRHLTELSVEHFTLV
ncbi:centromere protein L-like isoform X2 [Ostrea edulis]|uniref:centromere protein L-like isoform X2 n=1 Tax=Ostrea edulis TaxID=37623 RepID=UPI00209484F8|nr:centromere protein L-like isoform X2 [Ostrea edulis]